MSDMIDRLVAMSREAGTNASAGLNARSTLDSMEARIERGVRRRRQHIAGATALTVLIAGVGAMIAPRLLVNGDMSILPGTEVEVIQTIGALTVRADGSMSIVTSADDIVDLPPVAPGDYQPFSLVGAKEMCAGPDLDEFPLGWEYHQESASELLSLGRPLFLFDSGAGVLAQGVVHYASSPQDQPALGFRFEADPAIGSHVVLRSSSWMVSDVGTLNYGIYLDAMPLVTIEGGEGAVPPVAIIETGPVIRAGNCYPVGLQDLDNWYYPRYLQVDVFITDRAGNIMLIATHRSWSALDFSRIEEAPQ